MSRLFDCRDDQLMNAAVFLDRDGTINEDAGYVSRPEDLKLYPWAAQAVRAINQSGMKAIVVTNQSGVARGLHTEGDLRVVHDKMIAELAQAGAIIDAVYYCPHHPRFGDSRYGIDCDCRKPKPGLVNLAARELAIDLAASFVIGDKLSDLELALNAGAAPALVLTGYGRETLARLEGSRFRPAIIAADLLEAVDEVLNQRSRGPMTE